MRLRSNQTEQNMAGCLSSDDPLTRALLGKPCPYVPVAPVYEFLGPLQSYRLESRWRKWRSRLDAAGGDVLPVDYDAYFEVESETFAEILDSTYARPAWVNTPSISPCSEVAGQAVARQGDDLFWISADGAESWMPPNLQAQADADAADRSPEYADYWDRSEKSQSASSRAERLHHLERVPEPTLEQAEALCRSGQFDLAIWLARRYPDNLPIYTFRGTPYNNLMIPYGFRDLMLALVEEPDAVHRVLEGYLPLPSARAAAERRLGVEIMFLQECMSSADIISPRVYQEFSFPYTKQMLQFYENMGFRTVLYFSGNLMPFLAYLKELPFTALAFEEDRKGYGIDLAEVRRVLGPDRVLFGNVDASFVEKASDDDLIREVRRQISIAGRENFVLSVGSPFTPDTSLERVRLFCESTRRL